MLDSFNRFNRNINRARELGQLHASLSTLTLPTNFDDVLRSEIVYAVSALDKYIHDIINVGMYEIFTGVRQATPKYLIEEIPLDILDKMHVATVPPREIIFQQEIIRRLSLLSFQDPNKICDGLALVWNTTDKWARICTEMGLDKEQSRTKLKLIVQRRNKIVHEADIDPFTLQPTPITAVDSNDAVDFIERCVTAISRLV